MRERLRGHIGTGDGPGVPDLQNIIREQVVRINRLREHAGSGGWSCDARRDLSDEWTASGDCGQGGYYASSAGAISSR